MHIDSGGVDIHVEVTGAGRPVVLLHGFPDSGRLWRSQVAALSAAGFMVIVPDLRGYGGLGQAGHGRGRTRCCSWLATCWPFSTTWASTGPIWWATTLETALSWTLASLAPDRVDHLVALSVGHPAAFRSVGVEQLEKSWYMFFFQFEGVAERWLSDDSWANLRAWTNHPDIDAAIAELGRTVPHPGTQFGIGPTSPRRVGWTPHRSSRLSRPRPWGCGAPVTSP